MRYIHSQESLSVPEGGTLRPFHREISKTPEHTQHAQCDNPS